MTVALKGKKTTKKQQVFAKALARTKSTSKAANIADITQTHASFLKRQPHVQAAIKKAENDLQMALRKKGLDEDFVAEKLDEGCKATYVKKDGGEKYPDFHARDKSLDKIIKIHGGYAPEKHEIRQEKLTLIVTPEVLRGLRDSDAITAEEVKEVEAEIVEEDGRAKC